MINKLLNSIKLMFIFCLGFTLLTVNANAAATVSPTTAMDSLATPYFMVNVKACVELFDWAKFVSDKRAGIEQTSPFIKKGCLRQENFASNGSKNITKDANDNVVSVNYDLRPAMTVNVPFYKDFNGTTNTEAKQILGNMPVLGITNNQNTLSQYVDAVDANGQVYTKPACDRIQPQVLNTTPCIWSGEELNQIFGPQTVRTGAPRIIDTGVDEVVKREDGSLIHTGGPCYTQNGKMVVRSKIDVGGPRERDASKVYTEIPNQSILENCRFKLANGQNFTSMAVNCGVEPLRGNTAKTYIAIDQGMCANQFIFVIQMPTAQECQTLWDIAPIDYEEKCKSFWQKRFQGLFNQAPAKTGDKFVITRTYYGMYADSSFKCQVKGQTNCSTSYRFSNNGEWRNPDIGGPRANFQTQASREQLLQKLGEGYENYTLEQLRVEYNGMMRSMDGASTYFF
jgi:hypothetical protein